MGGRSWKGEDDPVDFHMIRNSQTLRHRLLTTWSTEESAGNKEASETPK